MSNICVTLLGIWNVRGINEIAKREEVVDVFEWLAFTETMKKESWEVSRCGLSGIFKGVQVTERTRGGWVLPFS